MRDSICLKAVATIQSKMGSVDSLSGSMCESVCEMCEIIDVLGPSAILFLIIELKDI